MDVTKLFEVPEDKLAPLSTDKLNVLIEQAVAHPQIQRKAGVPANQNSHSIKHILAVAAALAVVIAVSLQLKPVTAPTSVAISNDAYDDVSELLILETLNDLS